MMHSLPSFYVAYNRGKRNLDEFLVKNGVVCKDLQLDNMEAWKDVSPEPGLCSRITHFLVKAVEKRFPLGAYSSIFTRKMKTSLWYVEEKPNRPGHLPQPSRNMRDTAIEFLHSGNKSSSQYVNVSLSKNSGVRLPSADEQRFMLLHTLGLDLGSLDVICELCGNSVGSVSAHADCCNGTGTDRATRHNRMKYMVGKLLEQAPGLYVNYEPILLEYFNLKGGSAREVDLSNPNNQSEIVVEGEVRDVRERSDLLVRSADGYKSFWDFIIKGVLTSIGDEGTPGSRTLEGSYVKKKKHDKYVDVNRVLHGFALDTCGGMSPEANKAIDEWSKEVRSAHNPDGDDRIFFGARMRQCISMKLKQDKAASIMEVLRRARAKHIYPIKGVSMLSWPTLGLGTLYDLFNARDGVVSDEPIDLTGFLRRMVFNEQAYGRFMTRYR
jgi:hypothetical protein